MGVSQTEGPLRITGTYREYAGIMGDPKKYKQGLCKNHAENYLELGVGGLRFRTLRMGIAGSGCRVKVRGV